MAQFAVLVGCCYPNGDPEDALKGCYNDVETMKELLISRCGFDPENVEVLIDKPGFSLQPTGANIKAKLNEMIEQAESDDVLLFYFSGHGTHVDSGRGTDCRREEAIVPTDDNLLYNVDFRDMVDRVPEGADFIIIADSCHSGGLIDNLKEQVGPGLPPDLCYNLKSHTTSPVAKAKQIPITKIMQRLGRSTGSTRQEVRTQLLNVFGTDASLKYQMPAGTKKGFRVDRGIVISGCQFNESSWDASNDPRPHGMFTAALADVLKKQPGSISNRLLVEQCRAKLSEQRPCLFCSNENADEPFLHGS